MIKRWICLALALICLVCCLQPMQAFAAENRTGWVEENGNTYYIDPETGEKTYGTAIIDGKMCNFSSYGVYLGRETAGWIWVNGNTYYIMDNEGTVATGWKKLGGYWYFFNSSGHMHTGWLQLGSIWYYLDESGSMVTGEYLINGKIHVFDSNGVWLSEKAKKTGWVKENGYWYYYMLDGSMATGLMLIDGKLYAFDGEGKMFADTLVNETGGNSYYAGTDGALLTGWHCLKNGWYYFYKDGHMAKNTYIDNYYLNEKGMNTLTFTRTTLLNFDFGATREDSAKADALMREIAQDAMENGGETDMAKVRYATQRIMKLCTTGYSSNIALGPQYSVAGPMLYGISGNDSVTMAMSQILTYMGYENMRDGEYVYLKMDGEYGYVLPWNRDVGYGNPSDKGNYTPLAIVGDATSVPGTWVQSGGKWYYKTTNGKNHVGWLLVNDVWYYMNKDGSMKTGWHQEGKTWYYLNAGGAMKTNSWLASGGKWYYLDSNGIMKTGKFFADGQYYFADQNGVMRTGWVQASGKWYYMEKSGAMVFGKKTIGSNTFCFSPEGKMFVGWFRDYYGNWYYADRDGLMKTGWQVISGTYYYFYKDGHMAAQTFIDNYYVDESGAWVSTTAAKPDHQYYKHLSLQQAAEADAIAKQIAEEALAQPGKEGDKVAYAANLVQQYVRNCRYDNDENYYYRSPYGVFVAGVFTCAGATRAMGRVLDYMGYTWYHVGEDQWDHQWTVVKIDGEYAWIDIQKIGALSGFGNHMDNYNAY